jgi:O-antigen/teichoic acid export membrane protein
MSVLKKLAGQTAVYGLSSIVGRFLNYLLVPIYTRVFVGSEGVAEYGVSTYFYSVAAFGAVLFTYGMETAFFRFAQKDGEKPEKVFATATWSLVISSIFLALLIFLFADSWANSAGYAGKGAYFSFFAIIFAADAISTIPFAWLRKQNEALRFALLRFLSIGVNIGLNLLCYVFLPYLSTKGLGQPLDLSVRWMFIANVASSLVVLPFFKKEFQMLRYGFDKILWRKLFSYAYPIIFMGLAGMINETFDRILLKKLLPDPSTADYQIGIYGAVYKLSIIMTLFIQAFRFAAEPFFFAQAKGEDSKTTYANVLQYFILICSVIFVGVLLFLDVFKSFIGESYHSGLKVVPILLMANLFLGAYYNLSIWYKLTDKTRLGALVSILGALITLILNWLWIPLFGYVGSAWATLICYFSMAAISFYLGQHYYPVPYRTKRILSYLALATTTYLLSELIRDNLGYSVYQMIAINILLFFGFLFVLFKLEEPEARIFLDKSKEILSGFTGKIRRFLPFK